VGLSRRCFPLVIVPIEGLDLFVWGAIGGSLWVIGLNKGTLVASGGETGKLGNWEIGKLGNGIDWLAGYFVFPDYSSCSSSFLACTTSTVKKVMVRTKSRLFFCFTGKRVKVSNSRPSGDSALDIKYSLSPILHE
jgi:hypothetical protein